MRRRKVAGRMQILGAGLMLAALTAGAPAISAAQDPETDPSDPAVPSDPATGADVGSAVEGITDQAAGATTTTATPTTEARAADEKAQAAATTTVSVGDNFFKPPNITITAGDTIRWKNNGQSIHSA